MNAFSFSNGCERMMNGIQSVNALISRESAFLVSFYGVDLELDFDLML